MKFNKLAIAVLAVAAVPAANAGVTVSPLLLGYHYSDLKDTSDKQREILRVGKNLYADASNQNRDINETRGLRKDGIPNNGGVSKKSDLYTGAAIGIELTPSTQFQVEYGVSNAKGEASKDSTEVSSANRFDVKQEMISGNFLIGTEQFTGYTNSKFKPYILVGGGQSKIKVKSRDPYNTIVYNKDNTVYRGKDGKKQTNLPTDISPAELEKMGYYIPAGTQVSSSRDTIGNLGLGAMYRINDALSLRGEARAIHNFDNNWWEGMALAGLEVALGGHLAPKVPAPDFVEIEEVAVPEPEVEQPVQEEVIDIVEEPVDIDSDGDGVVDRIDACPNTPRNLVVDSRGCPKQIDVEENLKLELRVFFENDKSNVKPQYKPEIQKVAQAMHDFPNSTALIEGYASKTGPSALYNLRLSEARALAVKSMLTNEYGVQPTRITTKGYGYSRPIAPNNTAEGRAMNRRVYAVITGTKKVRVDATKNNSGQ